MIMKGEFCYKEHLSGKQVTLAVCDASLSGKVLIFGDVDFEVCDSFYGTRIADGDHILELSGKAGIINAVGKGIVGLLEKKGIVKKGTALIIDGVPHVQVIS